jgi:hypothetical protein
MGYSFTFKFSENDIDFSPQTGHFFNYHKFLLNEFFNSTDEEMITIMRTYEREFGNSAFKYVLKTYYWGWRHGDRTLSNVQKDRILSIMPALLNERAKQNLNKIKEEAKYRLGIEEVINGIKQTVESYFRHQRNLYSKDEIHTFEDIYNIFLKEIQRAKSLDLLGPFYVLDSNEKAEINQISKYIVFTKLKKQFNQIEKDFKTFSPYVKFFKRGIFSAEYNITFFNIRIDLTKTVFQEIEVPEFLVDEIVANSRFKKFSDKYLANELVSINTDANKAILDAFLNAHELKVFFDNYEELSHLQSELNMKSSFKGEAGNLKLQIQMKPIKMLKTSIAKSISKITIYTIILSMFILVVIRNKWGPILLLSGAGIVVFYINFISEEIKLIKHYKAEIKKYGQQ